jgi:hypothetical protein
MEEIVYESYTNTNSNLFFIFEKSISNIQIKQVKLNDTHFDKFDVIYENFETDTKIIMRDDIKLYNNVYVKQDGNQSNRYFIGLKYYHEYCDFSILGLIVYFDDLGNCAEKKILNRNLGRFDGRNGLVNMFLYNQTLLFTQIHRDTGILIVSINILSCEDLIINNIEKYTNIETNRDSIYGIVDYKRFIMINTKTINILLDLGSVKYIKEYKFDSIFKKKLDCFVINSYKVKRDELSNFIKEFDSEQEYFGNGYPHNCIQCKKITSITKFFYENLHVYLGESYCKDCNIRFSKSENRWECCKLNKNNYFCSATVLDNKLCDLEHSSTMKIIITNEEKTYIYPFKQKLNISKTEL